ncbi:hypothetical protein ACWFRM_23295 [Streptomyces sp. NPDC055144]
MSEPAPEPVAVQPPEALLRELAEAIARASDPYQDDPPAPAPTAADELLTVTPDPTTAQATLQEESA